MFRLKIRELFWITACIALGVGWWQSSHAGQEATIDAGLLLDVSPSQTVCRVNEASCLLELDSKHNAESCLLVTPRIVIVEEDEEKLGIDFEEN